MNITSPKGDKVLYTTCRCNCGSNSQCVLKAHIKDGVIIAVEPDDRYNTGVGREDEVLSEKDLVKTKLQRRPCAKGLAFHKYIYHDNRILYPLKRADGSTRGEGKYVKITWDEALETIANMMSKIRNKYGPYSVITPYMPNGTMERLFSFWGAGVDSWGWCSYDSIRMMSHIIAGEKGWDYYGYSSSSAADMLAHAKSIIIWGFDPAIGSCGPGHQFAWFIKLCREKGVPVIIIDPRYTVSAEVLADQWIPIKPGTDNAMFLGMANVLFKDGLWDKNFVKRYVEPEGFNKWQDYVMGTEDGIEKSPEWAETKCAVPAETIRNIVRLAAKIRPSWLLCHWSVSRKSRGEQTVRVFAALQAMLGYWGMPGGGPPIKLGPSRNIPTQALLGPNGEYEVPKMYRSHYWAQAVLLLDKLKQGEITEKDYMKKVGWRCSSKILKDFRPKMLLWGGGDKPHASDHLVTACESPNDQIQAFKHLEFIVTMHSIFTATVKYADIILPAQDWMWEEKNIFKSGDYGGFECINYCPGVVDPPGEVKPWMWVYTKLAEKLGIDTKKFFKYYTSDENWDKDWERYLSDSYQVVVEYYKKRNITIPSWEDFTNGKFINCDELDETPFVGWEEQIKEGKPFKTKSGKIEFYSEYIYNKNNKGKGAHFDYLGRLYDNLPSDWGSLTPMGIYENAVRGMNDALVTKYPLMLLAPHARYRVHYLFWEHPWLHDHVYRHRVWINVVDARMRSISDNDLVKVHNDRGVVVMPAYVTSRIMPGIVVIHHGGKYIPGKDGIDFGASPSTLLGGDFESCITPAKAATLVEVELWRGI